MSWAWDNRDAARALSGLSTCIWPCCRSCSASIVAIPVGIMCVRYRWTWPPILSLTSIFYALPSLALYPS